MPKTRVAIAQFQSVSSVAENLRTMRRQTFEAADQGAQIIMFHELATTDYFCYEDQDNKYLYLAETVPGRSTDTLAEVSSKAEVSILLPLYEQDGQKRFNTVVYIDPTKGIIGKYQKTHVPNVTDPKQKGADEAYYFQPGETGFLLPPDLAGVSIGTAICYDRHFPEVGRSYAIQGAHLIYVPTATYRDSVLLNWKAELQAYAYQNSIYVAGVNKIGPVLGSDINPDTQYPGGSVIYDPEGRLVAECGTGEEIAYVDIDPSHADATRTGTMKFLAARRPETYGLITQGVDA